MEHGQHTGESIGTLLASVASALREVSEKLDAVATRMDGTPLVPKEQSIEDRLAALEAWAFRTGQDISGLDTRVERLESSSAHPPVLPSNGVAESPATQYPGPDARDATETAPAALPVVDHAPVGSRYGVRPHNTPQESVHAAPEPDSTAHADSAAHKESAALSEPATAAPEPGAAARNHFAASVSHEAAPHRPDLAARKPGRGFAIRPLHEPAATAQSEPRNEPQQTSAGVREPGAATAAHSSPETATHKDTVADAESDRGHGPIGNGTAPGDHDSELAGAHRATEEDRAPAENAHVDKLQAMLDELKRTAAAPLDRSDIFGPPTGDTPLNGHRTEHVDAQHGPVGYRLSSSPPSS
ncbi:hypothetical protein ACL02S_04515 [Nocardia sp. 004]|uniref:hypothetical protein n=1 Tax=Nocardia sp. 004 TaxID=3385978 RepID=UPI0039A295D2